MRAADDPVSSWDLLETLPPDAWKDIYAGVRRRSRRRAAILLVALPVVVAGEVLYLLHYWSEQTDVLPFLANVGVACIGIAVVIVTALFLAAAIQALGSDGVVVRGEVLKKLGGAMQEKTFATVIAYLLETELLMDIETCIALGAGGLGSERPEWRTCRTIGAARRVHRRVAEGDDVLVACGPGGRAFAFVSEFVPSRSTRTDA